MWKPDGPTVFLGSVIVGSIVLVGSVVMLNHSADGQRDRGPALSDIPFDGQRSYGYLKDLCALGRRPSGSEGMQKQQEMLAKHFTQLGGQVSLQRFEAQHPLRADEQVPMANLIVQWHPQKSHRILLCAHYDTRPYPDRDRRQPRGVFVGANDGASGVAVWMELGRHMRTLKSPYGVDFVMFDGEEFIFEGERGTYFLGSEFFARDYVANKGNEPRVVYRWGVLLDMVGDAELHLFQELNSMRWKETRPLTESIWDKAKELGVRDFIHRTRYEIRDDHLSLRNIAGIPSCNIIDFDFPRPGARSYWHTVADTPDKCSPLSLAKVGWVVLEWLRDPP